MLLSFPVAYLPRPDAARTALDVDEIYTLTAEALQRASTPAERVQAFRTGLLRAYGAGVDGQRELVPAPSAGPRPTTPGGVWKGGKKR